MKRVGRRVLLGPLLLAVTIAACRPEPDPIRVDRERITVFNRNGAEWRDVELRVNRYYLVKVPSIAAGGRFDVPIARLQGGFGRYFDAKREQVRSVSVTATDATGRAVTLAWENGTMAKR